MKKMTLSQLSSIAGLAALCVIGLKPLRAQEASVQVRPSDTAAWALARYAVDLKYADLPPVVIAITKQRILDTLGCALGAYDAPPMIAIRGVIAKEGGLPEATVIGSGLKTSVVNATWVNGSMIRYLDCNDTYWDAAAKGYMHPSNSIATALAVAERQHANGKDLIVATVLGYEVQGRLADTFKWDGFEQQSAAGFTAPVVAGKLLGLTAKQVANAIGLGASHDFALAGDYGMGFVSDMKAFGYAAGSGNGVFAALLAEKGVTGPVTIIESFDRDFMKGVSLAPLVEPRRDFIVSKAWMKPYEAAQSDQAPIEAAIQLVREHSIKPDQIESVLVRGLPEGPFGHSRHPLHNTSIPVTKEDADHNSFYTIAAAITDGALGPDQYALQQWKDAAFQSLMGKITIEDDIELTKAFPRRQSSIVTVKTKDGQTYSQRVDLPKGRPENPFTDQELDGKFRGMALKLMPRAQVEKIISTVDHLEQLADVSTLTNLLVIPKETH